MSRILIVGTGDVGGKLALELSHKQHQIWGLRRSNKAVGEGVQMIQADVSDQETLINRLPDQLDYLVYAIASPEFTESGYDKYYVQGVQNILCQLKQLKTTLKRFILVSSTSIYHQSDGSWVDENSLTVPSAFAGKKLLETEGCVMKSDHPFTIVRFSGIYGPKRTQLIHQAISGRYCDPEPDIWTNRIHRDDCIGIIQFLIEHDIKGQPVDNLYLGSDLNPAPLFEVLEWLKDRIGEVEPDQTLINTYGRSNRRCNSKKIQELGYPFKYENYQAGYEEILRKMGY